MTLALLLFLVVGEHLEVDLRQVDVPLHGLDQRLARLTSICRWRLRQGRLAHVLEPRLRGLHSGEGSPFPVRAARLGR